MNRFLFFLLLLLICTQSNGQEFVASAPDFSEENILLDSLRKKSIKKCIVKEEYFIEQYGDYYRKNLKHRSDTFAWQLESSKYIFWLVLLVVLAGLLFSGIQFFLAMKSSGVEKRLHEKIKGGATCRRKAPD